MFGDGNSQYIEILPPRLAGTNKTYTLQVALDGKNFLDVPTVKLTVNNESVKGEGADGMNWVECGKEDLFNITATYVDEKGKEIAQAYKAQGYIISEWETYTPNIQAKEIEGYELVSAPDMSQYKGFIANKKDYNFQFKYKRIVDKTALEKAINGAKDIKKDNYTDKSWKVLQDAITEAEKVFKNSKATQDEVNAQVSALEKAIKGLVKKAPTIVNPNEGEELTPEITDKIVGSIENIDGTTEIVVEMNGATKVPQKVLEAAKGKDVYLTFDMGDYTWEIVGTKITADQLKEIDLGVEIGSNAIPQQLVDSVAGKNESIQISLVHDGEFGFEAKLSFNVGAENKGKNAVLYYYNEEGKLEKVQESVVGEDGTVTFVFTHASDYVVVLDEKSEPTPGPNPTPGETPESKPGQTQSDENSDELSGGKGAAKTGDTAQPFIYLMGMLVAAGACVLTFRKRSK